MPETTSSNTFSLADLQKAAEAKLGPTTFVLGPDDKVELPSVFRLGKTNRDAVVKALEDFEKLADLGDTDDDDGAAELLVEAVADILKLISKDGARLVKAVESSSDDPVLKASLLGDVLSKWMEHTRAGEA